MGDSKHFCPVTLKEKNILFPCTDEYAAKYKEKVYYFSSSEARETFLLNPEVYVAKTEPLKVSDNENYRIVNGLKDKKM